MHYETELFLGPMLPQLSDGVQKREGVGAGLKRVARITGQGEVRSGGHPDTPLNL